MNYIGNFLFSFSGISYLVVWLAVLLSMLQRNKNFDSIASAFVYLFTFFFLGLRDEYSGTDTKGYVDYFLTGAAVFGDPEPAYEIFTKVLREIGNWEFFLFANVAIQLVFISLICSILDFKNKAIVLLAYISFMPGFDMLTNGLRQGLAVTFAILVWAASFYKSYIPKISIFSVILFHKSMLAYIPLYFISRIKSEKNITFLINFFFFLFLFFIVMWHVVGTMFDMSLFIDYFSFSIYGTSLTFGEKMNVYMTSEQDMLLGVLKYYFLLVIIIFQVTYFLLIKHFTFSKNYSHILKLGFLFFYLTLVYSLSWESPFSFRFMYVSYLPGLLLSLSLIQKYNKNEYYFIAMFFILLSAVMTYGSNTYSKFHINI
ncbi:MAG: EpsG family protein [Parcubacteria group bacterium]|jgi:hypothetical protein